jgi:cytochrome c peroxidase
MMKNKFIILLLLVAGMYACRKELADIFNGFQRPSNFPEPVYHFNTNPVTKEGFELGRKLFYDPILSADNSISCGSCHIQTAAFTHHGHSVSHGIADRQGTRNAPPIMNLAWSKSFMWDGGIVDLDLQSVAPITNHLEMGETMQRVLEKLRQSTVYPSLFKKAFRTEDINTANFLKALSQFMLMCVSSHSKYDSVMRHEGNARFTAEEAEGQLLVKEKCGSCHTQPLFTDESFRNNGLSISMVDDKGRWLVTQAATDAYKFKVPSLRNLAYTAPYMHDGRFFTLDAVLEHYNAQVQPTENLDPFFQNNGALGIPLSSDEKKKIIAFLNTLNDKTFLFDKSLSEQ